MPIFPALSPAFRPNRSLRTFALAVGISASWLSNAPAYADSLDEAGQLLKSGQHAKALEQINHHLAAKPKDAQGRFLKGIILTGLNKPTEAIAIFQKLTEDYPELPEPYNNLAVIYAQQKQYEKAKQALEMAIRTHPAYATAHENLGDIYSRLASDAYSKALQIDSSNASAQTKLAMINDLVGSEKTRTAKPAAADKPADAPVITVAPPTPTVIARADTKPPESRSKPAAPPPLAPAKPVEVKPAETKPAEAKPASAVTPPPKHEPAKSTGSPDGEITAVIDGWLTAWSKKDVKSYLAHYAKDFQTPTGQSRKEWENERSQRVGKPGKIEVGRDKLAIKSEGDDRAIVRYRQHYKSANLSTSSGKILVLVKREGKWLIQQERVGG